ncbi:MAG: type II secretion system protein [Planctomycetota bacterium]
MPRRTPRAYTLIEMLIVVTILGIAAAIVVPQMLRAGTLGVQAATRIVVADILFAQNEAATRKTTRRVVFDVDNNSYQITDGDGQAVASTLQAGSNPVYEVSFEGDDRFQGVEILAADFNGAPILEFDDLGSPTSPSGGSVDLRFDNRQYRVRIAPFTGRVSIEKISG